MPATVTDRLGTDFTTEVLHRTFRHVPAGDGGADKEILTWRDLNDLLTFHSVGRLNLRLMRKGEPIPPARFARRVRAGSRSELRVSPHGLHTELAAGASLNIGGLDTVHHRVAELIQELESWLRTSLHTNLYASWTPTQGFGTHRDDHDVIVLQLEGAKRWRIYEPGRLTRDGSWRGDGRWLGAEPTETPTADVVLHPGDILYLPRQWWHTVLADQGVPSMHLTCGLVHHTGAELLHWVADQLASSPAFVRDLPLLGSAAEKSAHVRELREQVAGALADPEVLERYAATEDLQDAGYPRPHLPHVHGPAPDASTSVRLTAGRARLRTTADGALFAAAGREWTFPVEAEPLLRRLLDAVDLTHSELARVSGMSVEAVNAVVRELAEGQIVALGQV